MKLAKPERSTLLAGAVFAIAAVLYATVGIDSTETPATTAIPVYVVTTTTTTPPPAPSTPTTDLPPPDESSSTTGPATSAPATTARGETDVDPSLESRAPNATSPTS